MTRIGITGLLLTVVGSAVWAALVTLLLHWPFGVELALSGAGGGIIGWNVGEWMGRRT